MLIVSIAYDQGYNLGRAYNEVMRRLQDDDWCCFLDHDAMFTTRDWYPRLHRLTELCPSVGLFTCVTNRIGNSEQLALASTQEQQHNIKLHREYGTWRAEKHGDSFRIATKPVSGVMLMLSKATWHAMGYFKPGFLGVDNQAHKDVERIGKKVVILDGIYVYHWYRANGETHTGAPVCKS